MSCSMTNEAMCIIGACKTLDKPWSTTSVVPLLALTFFRPLGFPYSVIISVIYRGVKCSVRNSSHETCGSVPAFAMRVEAVDRRFLNQCPKSPPS